MADSYGAFLLKQGLYWMNSSALVGTNLNASGWYKWDELSEKKIERTITNMQHMFGMATKPGLELAKPLKGSDRSDSRQPECNHVTMAIWSICFPLARFVRGWEWLENGQAHRESMLLSYSSYRLVISPASPVAPVWEYKDWESGL